MVRPATMAIALLFACVAFSASAEQNSASAEQNSASAEQNSASAAKKTVIVFPLNGNLEDSSIEWLGEGIATSIAGQLRGKVFQVMDPMQRIRPSVK